MAVPWKRARIKPEEPSASEKVFATTELLEHILLNMRIKDILVNGQRVNKAWNATIQQSIKLQRALFFEPLPKDYTKEVVLPLGAVVLLRKKIEILVANPWIRYLMPSTDEDSECSEKKLENRARKDASWRRMLVSQPPVTGITGDPVRLEKVMPTVTGKTSCLISCLLKTGTVKYAWEVSGALARRLSARLPSKKQELRSKKQRLTVGSKAETEEHTSDSKRK